MKAEIEQYAQGSTLLHQWDARWKTVSIFIFIFTLAFLQQTLLALAALFISYSLLFILSLPKSLLIKRLTSVHILLVPCFLILPFTAEGNPVEFLGITISLDGVELAMLFYVRAVAIITASMVLI